jgi:hypothetical protein
MLQHEDDIKHNGNVAETKLDRVARDTAPVILQRRVDAELCERQPAAGEIEQHRVDAPADGRFAFVIDPGLWYVLEEDGEKFDVAESVNLERKLLLVCVDRLVGRETHHIDPCPAVSVVAPVHTSDADKHDDTKDGYDASPPHAKYSATHFLSLAYFKPPHALEELAVYDDAHDGAMSSKQKVIESHGRRGRFRVTLSILRLDSRRV